MKVPLSYFRLKDAIIDHVDPALKMGDVDTCIEWTNRLLKKVPNSPFHIVADLDFSTCPEDTAGKFDDWIVAQEAILPFGSAYTETNGFASNADEWHFHWFAYAESVTEDEFPHLNESWISPDHERIVLTGMESLQKAFQRELIDEEDFARDICECQVVFKFMKLMQEVSLRMKQFRHPLMVSSHDWDALLKIQPAGKNRAEQAGSGQPATRSESKSEAGDKPQPESEGRSR